jgi:SAM-dependent methyltransferase
MNVNLQWHERLPAHRGIEYWETGSECCDEIWESAYARFETPEMERAKFLSRFRRLGVVNWDRGWRVAELFCGRGNGLAVLEELGFVNLAGVDLSPSLLAQYSGRADLYVGDCRHLKFESSSLDAVIVQGGLHHLPDLTADLPQAMYEIHRVLRPSGLVLIVEPWRTLFLDCVHCLARQRIARRLYSRIDAFQTMTEREADTYFRWLMNPDAIRACLLRLFQVERATTSWGKLNFVGRKPAET